MMSWMKNLPNWPWNGELGLRIWFDMAEQKNLMVQTLQVMYGRIHLTNSICPIRRARSIYYNNLEMLNQTNLRMKIYKNILVGTIAVFFAVACDNDGYIDPISFVSPGTDATAPEVII